MAVSGVTRRPGQDVVTAVRPWAKWQQGKTSDKAVDHVATCFQHVVRLGEHATIKWRLWPKYGAILFFKKKNEKLTPKFYCQNSGKFNLSLEFGGNSLTNCKNCITKVSMTNFSSLNI